MIPLLLQHFSSTEKMVITTVCTNKPQGWDPLGPIGNERHHGPLSWVCDNKAWQSTRRPAKEIRTIPLKTQPYHILSHYRNGFTSMDKQDVRDVKTSCVPWLDCGYWIGQGGWSNGGRNVPFTHTKREKDSMRKEIDCTNACDSCPDGRQR
jgi:hypothetical protein